MHILRILKAMMPALYRSTMPAFVVILTVSDSLSEARGMLPRWLLGFAVLVVFSVGLRRHLYARPRTCPKCAQLRALARTGRRERTEAGEGETKAWLDEWRCGKCGHVEWIRVAMYRTAGGRS